MKLAISNIAWDNPFDDLAYKTMIDLGFSGLEIAPTKILGTTPYEDLAAAKAWVQNQSLQNHFEIPSMQSIWYGRAENIFASDEERNTLVAYTKKAIDFASAINCKNLVFGCPKNRNTSGDGCYEKAVHFFKELGDYADAKGTCIGMEANPTIYGTNFINTTQEAIDLVKDVNSPGFRLNLDIGTMIQNGESVDILQAHEEIINHVHISEPYLKPVQERELHKELAKFLDETGYSKYVSIEMGKIEKFEDITKIMRYVKKVF